MEFRSESCFSSMLGYTWLAVVGELGSDGAKWHHFLLLQFLHTPLTICLSPLLIALAITYWRLSSLDPCYGGSSPVRMPLCVVEVLEHLICEPGYDKSPGSQAVSVWGGEGRDSNTISPPRHSCRPEERYISSRADRPYIYWAPSGSQIEQVLGASHL